MKMELTKNRGDLERERDTLKVECDGLQNNINVMENTVEHLNTVITEKVNQYIIYIYIYKIIFGIYPSSRQRLL